MDAERRLHPDDDRRREPGRGQGIPCVHRVGRGLCVADGGAVPTGPYLVQGCDLPTDLPPAVQDMLPYIETGAATPALEFLSPIKGPALEQITVEVGSGIRTAEDGAALYDEDVEKQAQQLGLPGW